MSQNKHWDIMIQEVIIKYSIGFTVGETLITGSK